MTAPAPPQAEQEDLGSGGAFEVLLPLDVKVGEGRGRIRGDLGLHPSDGAHQAPIHALFPSRSLLPLRVRLFIDLLVEHLGAGPAPWVWGVGGAAPGVDGPAARRGEGLAPAPAEPPGV
ncbi:MAG: hypothetical protein JNM72_07310 [Deltaproteobacteria bacterium]|nr:hypothetical protein [Deltaproteobacteria bacterium]